MSDSFTSLQGPARPEPLDGSSRPPPNLLDPRAVTVIGAGPAGLMAAEVLSDAGLAVQVLDAMPSAGRKFLLAGKGGLNLTHGEPAERFAARYSDTDGQGLAAVDAWLQDFGADAVRRWASSLGVETFVGSSGRVFPVDLKAAPLLRRWLLRLRSRDLRLHMRHRFLGWDAAGAMRVASPAGEQTLAPGSTVVLALGGASWARLGSDGAWWPWLQARGVALDALQPSNCGFDLPAPGWSAFLRERHAGAPLKNVVLSVPAPALGEAGPPPDAAGPGQPLAFSARGECVLTETGLEGSLVYAASGAIRRALLGGPGAVTVWLDLLPDRSHDWIVAEVARPRGSRSWATHLKTRLNLDGARSALLFEALGRGGVDAPQAVARTLKALPVQLAQARPIDEAISTAGGVRLDGLDAQLMSAALPGTFFAGEMLAWDAPTGGYLLTACLASGRRAGQGAARWHRARG